MNDLLMKDMLGCFDTKNNQLKVQSSASAMLEAFRDYNKGNICFEQLELVVMASGNLMSPRQYKAIQEFKKQLDGQAANNQTTEQD